MRQTVAGTHSSRSDLVRLHADETYEFASRSILVGIEGIRMYAWDAFADMGIHNSSRSRMVDTFIAS